MEAAIADITALRYNCAVQIGYAKTRNWRTGAGFTLYISPLQPEPLLKASSEKHKSFKRLPEPLLGMCGAGAPQQLDDAFRLHAVPHPR